LIWRQRFTSADSPRRESAIARQFERDSAGLTAVNPEPEMSIS